MTPSWSSRTSNATFRKASTDAHKAASVAMKEVAGRRHRNFSGAGGSVCSGRIFSRDHRNSFPPVRIDHRVFDFHLRIQRTDPHTVVVRHSIGQRAWRKGLVLPGAWIKPLARSPTGYRRALRGFLRFRWVAVVLFLVGLGLTYVDSETRAHRFRPERRPRLFHHRGTGPVGASLEYTAGIAAQVTKIMSDYPEVEGTFALADSVSREAPPISAWFLCP